MFERTPLEGLYIYTPKVHRDDRGYFLECFNQAHFKELHLPCAFMQDNYSSSVYGTLRGLHFQKPPFEQTKLVGVSKGSIFDVAVDIRPESPTRGRWFGLTLNEGEHKYLYIPRGFAHGFLALTPVAEVTYKVDNPYNKASEGGIRYDDTTLQIKWPQVERLILSDKDKELPAFSI